MIGSIFMLLFFTNFTWKIQVKFGNWLYKNFPNSNLRIIWFSSIEHGWFEDYSWREIIYFFV